MNNQTISTPHIRHMPSYPSASDCLEEIPVEAVAFAIAALAVRLFAPVLSTPLFGIAAGLLATKLVLKLVERYDNGRVINLTKEALRFNKGYPNLQFITLVFALATSWIAQTVAFFTGAALGCFSAIILDVEHYKLLQQANRKTLI